MLVTLFGIVIAIKLVHCKNAEASIVVILSGKAMNVSLLHRLKAPRLMQFTLLGIVIEVRLEHP